MVQTTAAFRNWLKSNPNMKLSSDAAVLRITHEGVTNYESLLDFDEKSIQKLPVTCRSAIPAIVADPPNGIAAEAAVAGANINSISIRRLIVASNAVKYYTSIGRSITPASMHYTQVLSDFKVEWEDYKKLQEADEPAVPKINDREAERKVIKWVPIFMDVMPRTFGPKGPLSYVLRENSDVPAEADDPLNEESYFGASGSMMDELIKRLPHTGPVYKNDNKTVYMKIEEAVRGTSVESTVKTFARQKDGRGAYFALISNHAGDTKYRAISKKRLNLLQNIKWNGRSYPLESHVSNHRQAVDDLRECSQHITVPVPDQSQRVEYLIDSVTCQDNTLQAAIGLIRANTNNMRSDFEAAASSLIEVDPYKRSMRSNPRTATVSAIDYSAGRGETGVDLRWHPKSEFNKLSQDQKDELVKWQRSDDGKKLLKASRKNAVDKKRRRDDEDKESTSGKNGKSWKSKFKKALKSEKGIKSIMALLAEEEKSNAALVSALQAAASQKTPQNASSTAMVTSTTASTTPSSGGWGGSSPSVSWGTSTTPKPTSSNTAPPNPSVNALAATTFPATTLKLQSILKTKK